MKYEVSDDCIGCGLCVKTCPDIFEMGDNGHAIAKDINTTNKSAAEAKSDCPANAIEEKCC